MNLKSEQTARKRAQLKLERQKPLVTFAETCMASSKSYLVREVDKLASKEDIKIGEQRVWIKLRAWGLVFKHKNETNKNRSIVRMGKDITISMVCDVIINTKIKTNHNIKKRGNSEDRRNQNKHE